MQLKGFEDPKFSLPGMMRILFVHRNVADELLKGTGKTLAELQVDIDKSLRPASFPIPGKRILIDIKTSESEITLNNIAGYIEGSDPVLKKEFIIYSGHADHIGGSGSRINYGADDNASGCAALLSIAEAFQSLEKKPPRSIMFLWVSGEEIGLFGSEYYVSNPLVPLENTIADLNMDMIGRVKGVADSTSDNPMSGPDEVFVITGNQSRDLVNIAKEVDDASELDFDYSLSGRNHPLQLFARSDHYNFVKKDIPVLFFTTGLHTDYHSPGDVVEKIDFIKMEKITEAMFQIGYNVANMKSRLKVNNPFSKW
jgi:Zn-dependent M28 family amino/carboxypeptidase